MAPGSARHSLLSLTELLAGLGDPDTDFDGAGALATVAQTLDAGFGAVCGRIAALQVFGFDSPTAVERELIRIAHAADDQMELPGVGPGHVARATVAGTVGVIWVARQDRPFDDDEVQLLATIARIVGLAATMRQALEAERDARRDLERRVEDNRRLVAQLRERQGLLDRLFRIQQSISHRDPTQDVLDAVTAGALELLGVGRVSLRLLEVGEIETLVLVSSQGFDPDETSESLRTVGALNGPVAQAIDENRLIVEPETAEDGSPGAMMTTPVTVNGEVAGCLTVSTVDPTRRFSPPEQEALIAFAQHASLALQDARANDAMRSALDRERHRAEHDPLTSLPNRPTIRAALSHRIGLADKIPMTVLFVDLDRFKLTNDTLGHAFGDTVITVVADRLRTSVREADVVGRLSGDEFVVICEGITEVGAMEFAERLQDVIATPILDGHVDHVITASVGIARAHRGDSAEQVLANADLAMYRAKQKGRGRVEVFDDTLREQLEEKVTISQELRRALDQGELSVHLQPVVELPTRRVTGFEALVRWEHPTRGLLTPEDFVPQAEDTGLVVKIDKTVLDRTIDLLGAHPSARPIAVNLSARTFADPSLVTHIASRLATRSVDPSRLVIEVTETVLMDSSEATADHLEALRDLGLRVMIDDFGTGYSSLAYLQTFDVDGVKIDRGFIQRLGEDLRADAIVAAVFNMAAALDLIVVAEGVETDAQMDRVVALRDKERGSERAVELHGQGYLFGRPVEGQARLAGFVEVPMAVAVQ